MTEIHEIFRDDEKRRVLAKIKQTRRSLEGDVAPAAKAKPPTLDELRQVYASNPVRASPCLLAALGYDAPGASGMPPDDDIEF